jgi:hypothetical protein
MSGSSSTAHSTVYINSTASTEKLDSYSTARHPGTCSQPRQPRQLLDRSSTGSTGKASTAPRQRLDSRLDSASTEPRQLDSLTARAQQCASAVPAVTSLTPFIIESNAIITPKYAPWHAGGFAPAIGQLQLGCGLAAGFQINSNAGFANPTFPMRNPSSFANSATRHTPRRESRHFVMRRNSSILPTEN